MAVNLFLFIILMIKVAMANLLGHMWCTFQVPESNLKVYFFLILQLYS